MKLHLGAGAHGMDGWDNLDINVPETAFGIPEGWVRWQAPQPLPYAEASCDFVFTEHFIEHLSQPDGLAVLLEAYRVLKPGGILRVSTPDLRVLVHAYVENNLRFYEPVGFVPATKAQLLNYGMTSWGHQFTYDLEELGGTLRAAGFSKYSRKEVGKSAFHDLQGLECRPDLGDLVMEATK